MLGPANSTPHHSPPMYEFRSADMLCCNPPRSQRSPLPLARNDRLPPLSPHPRPVVPLPARLHHLLRRIGIFLRLRSLGEGDDQESQHGHGHGHYSMPEPGGDHARRHRRRPLDLRATVDLRLPLGSAPGRRRGRRRRGRRKGGCCCGGSRDRQADGRTCGAAEPASGTGAADGGWRLD